MGKTKKKHIKIKDPEFSTKTHKGTAASPNEIDYHYQKYSNIMDYLKVFVKKNKIHNVYIASGNIFNNLVNLNLNNMTIRSLVLNEKKVKAMLKESRSKRFFPIVLSVDMTDEGVYDSHANIIIVDNKQKQIELFEPHGYRTESSELGDITAAYNKKERVLKKYFKKLLPDYKFINVVDYVKRTSYQILYDPDDHTGYCVTWSTLYAEYRLLNPNIKVEELAKHIDKKITTDLLLRYSHKVEINLKKKDK